MVGKENFWTDIIDQPLTNSAENVESIMQGQCEDVKAASRGLIEARFVKLAFTTKTTGSTTNTSTNGKTTAATGKTSTTGTSTSATTSPKTGDDTNVMIWIALLAVSCTTLTGTKLLKKKSK